MVEVKNKKKPIYRLMVKQGHTNIRSRFLNKKAKKTYTLSTSRGQKVSKQVLETTDQITYTLKREQGQNMSATFVKTKRPTSHQLAEQGHKISKIRFWGKETKLLTNCVQNKATMFQKRC
jgi:hypothetical protein